MHSLERAGRLLATSAVARSRHAVIALGLAAGVAPVVGCGGGNLAEKIAEPKATTANEAMNEASDAGLSCLAVGARDTPLIVDMKAMDRADLEEVMHAGVGVVSYDCHKIKLLPDCRLAGDYGFVAVSLKTEAVQLATADDVHANLPFSGAFLVSAGYGRESSLDLATVMIGKRTTSVRQAGVGDAVGACAGATHFIRGAYVGAFAMKTGTIGKLETAATILHAGLSAKSTSSKNVDNRDGDPAKCEQVALDATTPPSDCSALLRLELIALSQDKSPPAATDAQADHPTTCPAGTFLADGVCTKDVSKPHACASDDLADCTAQCSKGDQESCASLAVLDLKSEKDTPIAAKLLGAACTAGVGKACNGLGVIAAKGIGQAVDFSAAMKHYTHACELGYMRACYNVAWSYAEGQGVAKDAAKATPIYERACAGGEGLACVNLGTMIAASTGPARDMKRAAKLFERACYGGEGQGCANLAVAYAKGDGVTQSSATAQSFQERACREGYQASCGGH